MSLSPQLREQIDACRPGSDDLALPALADLAAALPGDAALREEFARSRQFDQAVAAALHDLPVPAGLAERLLAAMVARGSQAEVDGADLDGPLGADRAEGVVEVASRPTTSFWRRPLSRRAWHYAAASAAVLLVAGSLGTWRWRGTPHEITPDLLAASLESWTNAAAAGRPVTALPRGYKLPATLVARPVSYHPFTTHQGWRAFAVNLSRPPAPAATLFIVRSRAKARLAAAPRSISASGGRAAFAWQAGGLVYVLVLDRGLRMEDYLAPPRQA
jgi:hypothetical protein